MAAFYGTGNDDDYALTAEADACAGHDKLLGGSGVEYDFGGAGSDTFVSRGETGAKVINDFTSGQDAIRLEGTPVRDCWSSNFQMGWSPHEQNDVHVFTRSTCPRGTAGS